MNALTGADVLIKNALFATLDPTSRAFEIEDVPFLLVDTVGFLQDLPHHLIKAFRSTLESALWCDLALIVCNGAGNYELEKQTTLETLQGMGFAAPYLIVYNQCDRRTDLIDLPHDGIAISAKYGIGLDTLRAKIMEILQDRFIRCTLSVPYKKFSEFSTLRPLIMERSCTYTEEGMEVRAIVPSIYAQMAKKYMIS